MPQRLALVTALIVLTSILPAAQQPPAGVRGGIMSPPIRTEAELKAQIAANPSMLWGYQELARLYQQNNRVQDAERVLRDALAVTPKPGAIYMQMVQLYPLQYNPERILSITSEWIGAEPQNALPYGMASNAHIELARRLRATPDEARPHIDEAWTAINEAKRFDENHPMIAGASMSILRMQMDIETVPAERAKLQQQIEALMQQVRSRAQMPIGGQGGVSGYMTSGTTGPGVVTSGGAVVSAGNARYPNAVRVGGNIAQPIKVKEVNPQYPPEAQQARVQGVVILEVIIGEHGKVVEARVLRSIPLLDQAAIDAVRQWEFSVTQLNGQAVPVIMTVTVSFNMQ
jgi:TonB family protein